MEKKFRSPVKAEEFAWSLKNKPLYKGMAYYAMVQHLPNESIVRYKRDDAKFGINFHPYRVIKNRGVSDSQSGCFR